MNANSNHLAETEALSILIVDDEPDVRAFVCDVLTEAGHIVREAESLKTASRSLRESVPDVIILDLIMPDRDGINCLEFLARDESTLRIPILMMSGFDKDMLSIARRLGGVLGLNMIGELTKPFTAPDLLAAIALKPAPKTSNLEIDGINEMEGQQ